jgi:hypothetical protein
MDEAKLRALAEQRSWYYESTRTSTVALDKTRAAAAEQGAGGILQPRQRSGRASRAEPAAQPARGLARRASRDNHEAGRLKA